MDTYISKDGKHKIYYVPDINKCIAGEMLNDYKVIYYFIKDDYFTDYINSDDDSKESYSKLSKKLLFTCDKDYYYTDGLEDAISAEFVYNKERDCFYMLFLKNNKVYASAPKILKL